jgi:murein L,D-transpeptidase YafK
MNTKIISLLFIAIIFFGFVSFSPSIYLHKVQHQNADSSTYYIIVDKSDYELKVYDAEGWYATYPVVFGSKDLGDKMKEGDKRTPNGNYKVLLKKVNKKWGQELLLDYPN